MNVITLKEFNEFLEKELKPAVLEFNGACGKAPELIDDIDIAVDMILNECKRVVEECNESIAAYTNKDRVERLDGIVDSYWTNTQLSNLFAVFGNKFGTDELYEAINHRDYDDVLLITYATELFPLAVSLAQGTIISGAAIIHAARLIIKNNKQKYTEDCDKAATWGENLADPDHSLEAYEYGGKLFYCIKRVTDDYIVKPFDFKNVKLGGI